MASVKNILFDLGGVLLNIDYNKTSVAFQKLGVQNFDELFSQFTANELFEKLETGKITKEHFYLEMAKHTYPGTQQTQIEEAWNAMLLDFRISSFEFFEPLKNKYNLYLLSNTNSHSSRRFSKNIIQSNRQTHDGRVFQHKLLFSFN
ncbi:MAG: hypothetical protein WDM71_11935 [Ferruginibacter sp.]